MHHTVCQGSSDPFYEVTYYIKWVTTSWTDGKINIVTSMIKGVQKNPSGRLFSFIFLNILYLKMGFILLETILILSLPALYLKDNLVFMKT